MCLADKFEFLAKAISMQFLELLSKQMDIFSFDKLDIFLHLPKTNQIQRNRKVSLTNDLRTVKNKDMAMLLIRA